MSLATRSKRLVYLTHRWTGISGCLLMLVWFVSGIVMLYVGYPKLTPWERLAALPELDTQQCCVSLHEALPEHAAMPGSVVLTSIAGSPAYVIKTAQGMQVYGGTERHADQQQPLSVTEEQAVQAAAHFIAQDADAGTVFPNGKADDAASGPPAPLPQATYRGQTVEDRWTHSRGLDAHRPLHVVDVQAAEPVTLYVSSSTGQVMLDAPRSQQLWNYVGAWLHWLYMFRSTSTDPVWTWIVIVLSLAGTVSAVTGLLVGLWRWRFRSRYKSGSHSPYREPWMKWHHVTGLVFGAFVCTWIFSGLMSMNPEGMFSPAHRPDLAAYAGNPPLPSEPLSDPAAVIHALHAQKFRPAELAWLGLGGEAYVLAHDRQADTRIIRLHEGKLVVSHTWKPDEVTAAARRLFKAEATYESVVRDYDAYYYQRHPEAMNGALVRGLPALRMDFQDPDRSRVYIDLNTGQVATSVSRQARVGRWLFYFLHSWDTPGLLNTRSWRDAVLIILSLGGIIISVAGIVIAWRRLRRHGLGAQGQRQRQADS